MNWWEEMEAKAKAEVEAREEAERQRINKLAEDEEARRKEIYSVGDLLAEKITKEKADKAEEEVRLHNSYEDFVKTEAEKKREQAYRWFSQKLEDKWRDEN